MSILAALRVYLATCPCLGALTGGIKVDWTDGAGDYGVMPMGETTVEHYMDGAWLNQYQFKLYARRLTYADVERTENTEFLERFSRWIEDNEKAGIYPALGEGLKAESISCANGALFEYDKTGGTGVYMVQLTMTYERRAHD